jgi:hypothetical protein
MRGNDEGGFAMATHPFHSSIPLIGFHRPYAGAGAGQRDYGKDYGKDERPSQYAIAKPCMQMM